MVNHTPFLGRGWSFPPEFDESGQLRMSADDDDIRESLHLLFTTAAGERLMRPEYGGGLDRHVFARINATSITMMADEIRSAILHFEPRILVEDVRVDDSGVGEGRLLFEVAYQVIATNTRSNMVFPFYFSEGTNLVSR
jgi:phage baseplate assembly protein W